MKITGAMLLSAMLILLFLTTIQLSANFKTIVIYFVIFAMTAVICGMIIAFIFNLPSGNTIVILHELLLLTLFVIRKIYYTQRETT